MKQAENSFLAFAQRIQEAIGDGQATIGVAQGQTKEVVIEAEGVDERLRIRGPARVENLAGVGSGVTLEQGGVANFSRSTRRGPTRERVDPAKMVVFLPEEEPATYGVSYRQRRVSVPLLGALVDKILGPARKVTSVGITGDQLRQLEKTPGVEIGKFSVIR